MVLAAPILYDLISSERIQVSPSLQYITNPLGKLGSRGCTKCGIGVIIPCIFRIRGQKIQTASRFKLPKIEHIDIIALFILGSNNPIMKSFKPLRLFWTAVTLLLNRSGPYYKPVIRKAPHLLL